MQQESEHLPEFKSSVKREKQETKQQHIYNEQEPMLLRAGN